jgi:hypothetical protein
LSRVVKDIPPTSFLADLHPLEVVYMHSKKLSDVVHGFVSRLVDDGTIQVHSNYSVQKITSKEATSVEEYQVLRQLDKEIRSFYTGLVAVLITTPIFQNTLRCVDAFEKYFTKSKKFGRLFYINFGVLSVLALLGVIRLFTGILGDKPVEIISVELIVLGVTIVMFLRRLPSQVCTVTVPAFYRAEVPRRPDADDWQWRYFLLGSAGLAASFVPLVHNVNRADSSGSSSSCG